MPQPDPKYVSAQRPVNRRTAPRQLLQADAVNPLVQQRLAAKWAKRRWGAPLAEQLRALGQTHARQELSPWFIAGLLVSAAAAVTLLLAAIGQSAPLALASAAVLAGGLGLISFIGLKRRREAAASPAGPALAPLFDEACLLAFDRALDALAPEATEAVAARLTSIKQQLARIAGLSINGPVDEHFTLDDRLYLAELVRRYLPDSLQAYLRVPQAQRTSALPAQAGSAESLLLGQLQLLGAGLDQRELKLTHSRAEALIRQQRFLESKSAR
jgi:hypothetical protein